MRNVKMTLEVLLVEVAFLTKMTEMISISFMQLDVIFKFRVVNKSFLASLKCTSVLWLFMVETMPGQMFLSCEKFSTDF